MMKRTRWNSGFTMIEMISVLVVIGIIGVTVVGHQISLGTEARTQANIIKNHLRYAQSLCMNSNMVWGICCDGNDYWLFQNGDTSQEVMLPTEETEKVSLSDRGISMAAFTVSFTTADVMGGIPCTDAGASMVQIGDRNITVSSGGDSETITITQNTGYIP
jgi:prepilin-type N-terminal cleavage/methylation domain-containing protein